MYMENLLGPAPDLMPAVDAVAIIDPPDCFLSAFVMRIALDAYLTAKNTLSHRQPPRRSGHLSCSPRNVDLERPHKLVERNIRDGLGGRADDAGVGEKHVEASVCRDGLVDDCLDGVLARRIKRARMHIHARVRRAQLRLERGQVRRVVVADI